MVTDGIKTQWGAKLPRSYLNAHEITLGPTSLTWNEVLGRTMCARQFVEPHLLDAVRKYGFRSGDGEAKQVSPMERSAKRQRIENGAEGMEVVKMIEGMRTDRWDRPL